MSRAALAVSLICAAPAAADVPADFVRLEPPRPGEWRAVFSEPPQSLEDYRRTSGRALPFQTRRIRLVPFGEAVEGDDAMLARLAAFLAAYFATVTEIEPRRAVPDEVARRRTRGFGTQYRAEHVLDAIARDPPTGTAARLAVTAHDLWAGSPSGGELAFVFGLGGAARRVGVVSTARYRMHVTGEGVGETLMRRIAKVAAHEIGHVMGLAHCRTYACGMNGSNSLGESDSRPLHLCPECLEKLVWHLGVDPALRYRALEKACGDLGWADDAALAARQRDRLAARGARREVPGGEGER